MTSDASGKTTQAGELLNDLRAEVEKNRLRTPVGPAKTPAPPPAPPPTTTAAAAAPKPAPKADPSAAPWLDVARKEVGQKENTDKGDAQRAHRRLSRSTKGKFKDDETAWCSSFMNWVMAAGTPVRTALWPSKSRAGRRFHPSSTAATGGHRHLVGRSGNNIVLLGGNQGDAVQYRSYPAKAQIRLPPDTTPGRTLRD